jgi:hypothetical protein
MSLGLTAPYGLWPARCHLRNETGCGAYGDREEITWRFAALRGMAKLLCGHGESHPDRRRLLPERQCREATASPALGASAGFLMPGSDASSRFPGRRRIPRCRAVKRAANAHAILPVRSAVISIACPSLFAGCITSALHLHCTCAECALEVHWKPARPAVELRHGKRMAQKANASCSAVHGTHALLLWRGRL